MIMRTVPVGMLQTNCYIVADEKNKVCAVIDPGASPDKIIETAEQMGVSITHIFLTHTHWDHILAVPHVQQKTGAQLFVHRNEEDWLDPESVKHRSYEKADYKKPNINGYLEEGKTISVGELNFSVMHTPGHSAGSCVLICGDCMFTGDTLFLECCGRTDLLGSTPEDMPKSLARIAAVQGDYKVYPGHEESSTLEHERAHNRYMIAAVRG